MFAAGERRLAGVLDELQDLYLLRLDHALQAVYAVQRRGGSDRCGPACWPRPSTAVRELDAAHLHRVSAVRGEFYAGAAAARPAGDRRAPRRGGRPGSATPPLVVIAGGHVGVLADALHLFNVAASLRSPVIAWSAGAMALAERIVLFHDRSAHGPGHPEVYGSGLSVVRDMVPLPHARARLLLDDAPRMAVFARRFAPGPLCPAGERHPDGHRQRHGNCPPGTRVLAADGRVTTLEAA